MLSGFGPRLIDLGNPVADHPLNRGLVAWWLPLPNNSGGTRLHDITGHGNTGTLTNGPTWTTGPPGGGAAVRCVAASSHRVQFPDLSAYDGSAAATLIVVLRRTVATPGSDAVSGCFRFRYADPTSGNAHYPYTDGNLYLGVFNGNAVGRPINGFSDAGFVKTAWHHLAVVNRGSGAGDYRLIRNGVLVTSGTGLAACTFGTVPRLGSSSDTLHGDIEFAGAWLWPTRALSDSEVAVHSDQSLRGYPDLLRRYTPAVWSFGKPAAGGGGGGNRRRRVLMGASR